MVDTTLTYICSHWLVLTLVTWFLMFIIVAFFSGTQGRDAQASVGFVLLLSGVFAIGTTCGVIVLLLMWQVVVTLMGTILLLWGMKKVIG